MKLIEVVGSFQRSSYSRQLGDCVEVAHTVGDARAIRDSKRQDGPVVFVSRSGWSAFLRQFS
ncbi:DUF397 domain-containing protein [Streptomyces sp. NPDC086091]|uniref:DUF397 domain-containing protein n=1 Tax=Streptomyces sp. NPDC086091 TaxID=3365751 RepID=UPI003812EE13